MEKFIRHIKWLFCKAFVGRSYFHLAPQRRIDKMIADKKTWGDIQKEFSQPEWCNYPDALQGEMGCWSLVDMGKDGLRTKISHKLCKGCDCYK